MLRVVQSYLKLELRYLDKDMLLRTVKACMRMFKAMVNCVVCLTTRKFLVLRGECQWKS